MSEIQTRLDEVFDQAIVFHGFAAYMRDYEVYVYCTADPKRGIEPETVRLIFKNCVEAVVTTALASETWAKSLDDRLLDFATDVDLEGYVWGVKWQLLYPGGSVVHNSPTAKRWSNSLGIDVHEVRLETNGHDIALVFTDLVSTVIEPGHVPFRVERAGPGSKLPWG
ncbi:hypothetical protein BH24ACT5_BH24ACT5_13760 [soil metagenome]